MPPLGQFDGRFGPFAYQLVYAKPLDLPMTSLAWQFDMLSLYVM